MRREKQLNPILSTPPNPDRQTSERKIRADKLHDIKIPVSAVVDSILRRESRKRWGGSKTAIGTDILKYGLENIFMFPAVEYKQQEKTVHCKVDQATFLKIADLADIWGYSIRKAAHRVFTESLKKKQLGSVTNGEI